MYELTYTNQALDDSKKVEKSNLQSKFLDLLEMIRDDPFQNPPPYKKLTGDSKGAYSRRVNIKHRLVYEVDKNNKRIKILSMWSHYGDN